MERKSSDHFYLPNMEKSKSSRKGPQIMKTLAESSHALAAPSGFANKQLFESPGGSFADLTLGGPFTGNYHAFKERGFVGGIENRKNENAGFSRLDDGKKTVHVLGLEFSLPSEGGDGNNSVVIAPCSQSEKSNRRDIDNIKYRDESANQYGNGNFSVSVPPVGADDKEDVYAFDEGDRQFSVGDFVWGKIRSNTWWPGVVYSPSDASEYAAKHRERERLLVAYFGDGSFSWCHPSQLESFMEDFVSMSKQSDSRIFVDAVDAALCTISRLVELEMTCSCQEEEIGLKISRPLASNAGIREEVLVPMGGGGRFSVVGFEPAKLIMDLKNIARDVSANNILEFTVLKSQLSAFYKAKGRYHLQVFCAPQSISGLEDKDLKPSMGGGGDFMDFQAGEEWRSSAKLVSRQKHLDISEDKLYQKRKQKSMAEILEEDVADMEAQDTEQQEMEKGRRSRMKKKMKPSSIENEENYGKIGSRRMRKRKLKFSVGETLDRDEEGNNKGFSNGVDSSGESHENPKIRERKKSKYLSAPYTTDLKQWIQYSNSSDHTEFLEPSDGGSIECTAFPEFEGDDAVQSPRSEAWNHMEEEDVMAISATTILSDLESAASGSDYNKIFLKEFLSVFRSSAYCHGSNYKAYHKSRPYPLEEEAKWDDMCDSSGMGGVGVEIPSSSTLEQPCFVLQVKYIKQKLEMLRSALESCGGGSMSPDMVWRFHGEINGVMEVVTAMEGSG